jgi:large subunit ribosomal protein L24
MQAMKPVTKPSKQRKMLFQAPAHIRHKHFAAPLSPELKTSHLTKSLPVRSGDTVRVMRGDHKGFEGKITRVDLGKYRIYVEGLTREKVDGTTIFLSVHPSKVMITRLNLDDKWRKKILEKKKAAGKKPKRVEKKPAEEVTEEKEEIIEKKVVTEKKPAAKKPRRKRKPAEKPEAEKKAKKPKEAKKEEKPEPEKKKAKRKTAKKTEGET